MSALHLVTDWPVDHVAAAIVTADGIEPADLDSIGDTRREFRLASLSKPLAAWATMIAVEEGIIGLDTPVGRTDVPEGATLRHLLSHASGLAFDGDQQLARPGQRRIYSNTGFERVAAIVSEAAAMPFDTYLAEAVFQPLGMSATTLRGSAAHQVHSTVADMTSFVREMLHPTLLAPETHDDVVRPQYPDLSGIVPGVGTFDPCPWGLGVEIKGGKSPHWTGRANSAATFGHFGGAGTMMWADPHAGVGVVALTDRPFEQWADDALRLWPEFSDTALADHRSGR